jgi:opacity protein-like surface antigen
MKKVMLAALLFLGFTTTVIAQDKPKVEVFGGYSYLHTSENGAGINSNGGSGSVAFNANDWFGVVGDFGYYHASPDVSAIAVLLPGVSASANLNTFSFLFGPKIAMRHNEKFTPFAQALFGGAHQKTTLDVTGFGSTSTSETAFAMALGGGFDVKVAKSVAIRLVQAEYVLTKFNDGDSNRQNSVRISTGLVFRFGQH